jgi:hypothetical protein
MFYPISMRGAKDIYKVEIDIREKALPLLQRVPTVWAEYVVDANLFATE